MKILKATVINNLATDLVILQTDMPSALPRVSSQNLTLLFDAEYGTGEEYVKTNFPNIPIEIITVPSSIKKQK